MSKMISLADYFVAQAFPDGVPSRSYPAYEGDHAIDPEGYEAWKRGYLELTTPIALAEATAWERICVQAANHEIEVFAFRNIETDPGNLTDYTSRWTSARERVPPELFEQPIRFGTGNPCVIYNDGNYVIWNAPYKDPMMRIMAASPQPQPPLVKGKGGRPTKGGPEIIAEFNRRLEAGETEDVLTDEARALWNWFNVTYPGRPLMQLKPLRKLITEGHSRRAPILPLKSQA